MKKLAGMVVAFVLAGGAVPAQEPSRLYTRPAVPSREELARLNLKLAWRIYMPMGGRRDGFFSVQIAGPQMFVQTRSGTVTALNLADGTTQWRTQMDVPYREGLLLAYNTRSVFVVRGPRLYALERSTGQPQWEFELPSGPSATPVADDERIYFAVGGTRLYVYELPKLRKPGEPAKEPPPEQKPETSEGGYSANSVLRNRSLGLTPEARAYLNRGAEPRLVFSYLVEGRLEQAPLLAENILVITGSDGTVSGLAQEDNRLLYRFATRSPLAARLGQYHDVAYIAAQDYSVYALDMLAGKVLWRFTGGSPILSKPEVNESSIYVVSQVNGLHQLNRGTGDVEWENSRAVRFLAANEKFVYAADQSGRLLILDRERGTQQGVFNARDFVFPVSNEWSDRFFLAANDGLLLCLHDRDFPAPVVMKKPREKKPTPVKQDKGEGKTPDKPADKGEDKAPDKPADKAPDKPADKGDGKEK